MFQRLTIICILTIAILLPPAAVRAQLECVDKLSSCSCRLKDGRLIDLSPIQGSPGPAFSHDSPDGYTYLYNPCLSYKCGTEVDAAWCKEKKVIIMQYDDFGVQSSARFENDPTTGNLRIRYLSRDSSKTSYVNLICDPNAVEASVTTNGAQSTATLTADLRSRNACPVSAIGAGGLSGGDILLIVTFTLLAVYLLVGVLLNRFVRNQSGRDVLPNVAFWISLPGLVADGSAFVYEKLRDLVLRRSGSGYSEVK